MSMTRHVQLAACAAILVRAGPAWAAPPPPPPPPPLTTSETFADFGLLDQSETICASHGCGATAAVNGLWFLQQQYSTTFGHSLIPQVKPDDEIGDLTAVANTLAGASYMNTQKDTSISYFIFGKDKYLNEVAGQKIKIAVQTKEPWTGPPGKAPAYVERVTPTPVFLFSELKDKEAVEVLLAYDGGGGHYVTLTGIDYQPTANGGAGTLTFVDPSHPKLPSGGPSSLEISQSSQDGVISGVYKPFDTGEVHAFTITFAEGESPTPEPGAWLLLLAGFGGVGGALRLKRRGHADAATGRPTA